MAAGTGRPRKEQFAARALSYAVEAPEAEINLLVGHSFDRPLASKLRGTLQLRDTAEALSFTAIISAAVAATSHARDILALIGAGLAVGVSPGFRLPPERAVPREEAESIEEEEVDPAKGNHGAIIRTIKAAILREISVVTAPAYSDAQVELRRWQPDPPRRVLVPAAALRWRR